MGPLAMAAPRYDGPYEQRRSQEFASGVGTKEGV